MTFHQLPTLRGDETTAIHGGGTSKVVTGMSAHIASNLDFKKHNWHLPYFGIFIIIQCMRLEDYFPIGKVTYQGRAVKLREGKHPSG